MNDGAIDDWVYTGRGVSPTLRWSFTVDAPLVDIRLGRETGEVIAADVWRQGVAVQETHRWARDAQVIQREKAV